MRRAATLKLAVLLIADSISHPWTASSLTVASTARGEEVNDELLKLPITWDRLVEPPPAGGQATCKVEKQREQGQHYEVRDDCHGRHCSGWPGLGANGSPTV